MRKRNKFSLSHYRLFSCDMGELVPCACMEVLPGDTFQQATSLLVRVSPLLAPVMHPVEVRLHHWYVPTRLIWEDFEDFITGGPDGDNTSVPPTDNRSVLEESLEDYLGVPPSGVAFNFSALPRRAYALVWNEWYRDQDLQAELVISKASGSDNAQIPVQNVNWEKDYFTTARPWEQKGAAITLPLGVVSGQGPVHFPTAPYVFTPTGGSHADANALSGALGSQATTWSANPTTAGIRKLVMPSDAYADITATVGAVSINDLREAFALQRYQENRARYGSRFTEYLASLGVRSSDARLQRPEYLGGGKQIIQFSEVLQTAPESGGADVGVGDLRGHGIGAMRSNRYRRFFEEHGYVLSLFSCRPKTMYAQGLPRMFSRQIKEDYFQPELQHIGQQEVFNREIKVDHSAPNGVFGYQDRYDEYRRHESGVAGDFRSTLDFWHYARVFAGDVALNADFVSAVPTKRTNVVQTGNVLWIMAKHSVQARRLLTAVGTSFIR